MRCFVVALVISLAPTIAEPCSCLRIATIEEAIEQQPLLVEAHAVAREEINSKEYGHQVRSVTLRVVRVLKGRLESAVIVVEHRMCYASLYLELMKTGHTYILPLSAPAKGAYQLAGCAHSGLELAGGKLFTFEQTNGANRKLVFYKSYPNFLSELQKAGSGS